MKLEIGRPSGARASLVERVAEIRAQLADAARAVGRDPETVRLVGVSKRQPREIVLAAIAAGLDEIGESYVQEAEAKLAGLPEHVRKHFIGHVQSNKAKAIVRTFDVVQSVDRLAAGLALAKAARELGRSVTALVQVNISPAERYGVAPGDARELAERLREAGIEVDGVMAIGPLTNDRAAIRSAFETAGETFHRVGGATLSLGMSGDYREAIACGSTMIRIGTALFGARV
jgi:pyridoxal phosphate enzyme (YggS family)